VLDDVLDLRRGDQVPIGVPGFFLALVAGANRSWVLGRR